MHDAPGQPSPAAPAVRIAPAVIADAALAVVVGVLAWVALGIGGLLLVAGVAAVSVCLGRFGVFASPLLALAAGIAIDVAVLAVLAAITALVAPHASFAVTAPVLLVLPPLAAAAVWLALRRRPPRTPHPGARGEYRVIAGIMIVATTTAAVVGARGPSHGFAWAMSGDATNQITVARSIIDHDGLTFAQLHQYPPIANLLAALVTSTAGRSGLAPGALLAHDARALAAVTVLLIAGTGAMFAAGVAQYARLSRGGGAPAPVAWVLMALAAAVAGTQLVAGVALVGGFTSAIAGLLFAVVTSVLAMRALTAPSPVLLVLVLVAVGLACLAWVIVGVALAGVILLVVLGGLGELRRADPSDPHRAVQAAACGLGALGLVVLVVGVLAAHHSLLNGIAEPGSIAHMRRWVVPVLTLLAAVGALVTRRTDAWRAFLVPVIVGGTGCVLAFGLTRFDLGIRVSNYYAVKFLWLQAAAISWVPIALALVLLEARSRAAPRRLAAAAAAVAAGLVVLAAAAVMFTGRPANVVRWMADGGDFRNQAALGQLLDLADHGQPVVVWYARQKGTPLNYMNFAAAAAYASVRPPGARLVPSAAADPEYRVTPAAARFQSWAANRFVTVRDGAPIGVLCTLLAGQAAVTVVTPTPATRYHLVATCPQLAGRVRAFVTPA